MHVVFVYSEAKRVFNKADDYDRFITIQKFYKDNFSLVVDLRSIEDNTRQRHREEDREHAKTWGSPRNHKTGHATVDITCKIYVLSDDLVNLMNNNLQSIQYYLHGII